MTTLLEWLNHFINFQNQHKILTNFLLTLTIGFLAVTIRRYLLSAVPDGINITERRRKVVSIRNSVAGLAIFLIVLVWSTELKTFMVSLLAITAAIVLATKEVIMAAIGGMIRTTSKRYQIGDRIEVKNHKGDVVDITLLSTTLMELSTTPGLQMYTGKLVYIPHSMLLTDAVHVHHIISSYGVHTFSIPVGSNKNPALEKENVQRVCDEVVATFLDDAVTHYEHLRAHTALDLPSVHPRTVLRADEKGNWWITIRMVAPLKETQKTEQAIIQRYLAGAGAPVLDSFVVR